MIADINNAGRGYKPAINDYFEDRDPFKNFIEGYLHLNGCGKKFKLFKEKVEETGSYREVNDRLNFAKAIGNIIRIVSYILVPLPLIALGVRTWLRKTKDMNVKSIIDKNVFKEEKYTRLAAEKIEISYFSTKTNEGKILDKFLNIGGRFSHKNYNKFKQIIENYSVIAPDALENFVDIIIARKNIVKGEYEIHLMVMKYLRSTESDDYIPASTRQKLLEKLNNFLKSKINQAAQNNKKDHIIYQIVLSIKPQLIGTRPTWKKEDEDKFEKEITYAKEISKIIRKLVHSSWKAECTSLLLSKDYIQDIIEGKRKIDQPNPGEEETEVHPIHPIFSENAKLFYDIMHL